MLDYQYEFWKVMIVDPLATGNNTLVSPISSRDILIMGGGQYQNNRKNTEAYIYDAISNTSKPQSRLKWQGPAI